MNIAAIKKFIDSKNTVITVKPATSLQTNGIYAYSRNPMYLGLICLYTGIAFLIENGWAIVFIPFLILVIQHYVIKREEKYLERAFDQEYRDYKKKVSRWI